MSLVSTFSNLPTLDDLVTAFLSDSKYEDAFMPTVNVRKLPKVYIAYKTTEFN